MREEFCIIFMCQNVWKLKRYAMQADLPRGNAMWRLGLAGIRFLPYRKFEFGISSCVDSSGDNAIVNNYKQWVGFKWVIDQKNGVVALADSLFPINWESVDRSSYARAVPCRLATVPVT